VCPAPLLGVASTSELPVHRRRGPSAPVRDAPKVQSHTLAWLGSLAVWPVFTRGLAQTNARLSSNVTGDYGEFMFNPCSPVRFGDCTAYERLSCGAARWMVFGSESAFGAAPRFCCFKRPDSSWQPCGSELQSWTPVTEGGARLVCYLLAARWRYAQSPPRSCSLCDLRHPDPVRLRGDVLCSGASFSHMLRECRD
jgi:hypothetical protein